MTNIQTTSPGEPMPTKGELSQEAPDFDLFAELFAAFFPVPVPAIAKPQPETAATAGEQFPGGELVGASDADAAHLLPTGASIAADAEEFRAERPAPDLTPLPVLSPANHNGIPIPKGKPRLNAMSEEKIKAALNDPANFDPASAVKVPVKNEIDCGMPVRDDVTCGMPATKGKVMASFSAPMSALLPETGGHAPVDILTAGDADAPVEIEVLELPPVQPLKQDKVEETETVLELSSVPDAGAVDAAVPAPVISAMPAVAAHRHHVSGALHLPPRPERIDVESTTADPKPGAHRPLLDIFTNNVMADSRSSLAARSLAKDGIDADAPAPIFAESLAEQENADAEAGFGFDTSVGGETQFVKAEKPSLSEAKMRRVVYEQVGSHVNEMAAAQDPGGKSELTIKLSPAELGSVEITLAKNADGVIDAHFRTDNPHAQQAINETLAQLRESLERSGMQVGSLNTSCSSSSSSSHGGGAGERDTKPSGNGASVMRTAETSTKSDGDADRLVSLRA